MRWRHSSTSTGGRREADLSPVLALEPRQLVVQVRLDVLPAVCQAGKRVRPQVDACEQVVAEGAHRDRLAQVAVGARDELKVAPGVAVGADGEERLLLQRPEQHGLLVEPQFADLVQEQDPAVGRAQQTGPGGDGAGERPLDVPEQRRGRRVAAQRRTVDLDERPRQLGARPAQVVDAAREPALARAGRTVEQDRRAGVEGDPLHLVDERVEGVVARLDARLQELARVLVPLGLARRDPVVGREVEVDDAVRADRVARVALAPRALGGRRLHEPPRQVARLGEQEEADLDHVRARRQVDEVVLGLGVEGVARHHVVERGVDLLEVPRVGQRDAVEPYLGLGRDHLDVLCDQLREGLVRRLVNQLVAVEEQVGLLRQRDAGPPAVPARGLVRAAAVERGADEAEGDGGHEEGAEGEGLPRGRGGASGGAASTGDAAWQRALGVPTLRGRLASLAQKDTRCARE